MSKPNILGILKNVEIEPKPEPKAEVFAAGIPTSSQVRADLQVRAWAAAKPQDKTILAGKFHLLVAMADGTKKLHALADVPEDSLIGIIEATSSKYIVQQEDVGKDAGDSSGRGPLAPLGLVQPGDVGKICMEVSPGIWQVENEEQFKARTSVQAADVVKEFDEKGEHTKPPTEKDHLVDLEDKKRPAVVVDVTPHKDDDIGGPKESLYTAKEVSISDLRQAAGKFALAVWCVSMEDAKAQAKSLERRRADKMPLPDHWTPPAPEAAGEGLKEVTDDVGVKRLGYVEIKKPSSPQAVEEPPKTTTREELAKERRGQVMASAGLYEALKTAGFKMANHESDLYVEDKPEVREILAKFGKTVDGHNVQTFISQVEKTPWLDIPFAYAPFWDKKQVQAGGYSLKKVRAAGPVTVSFKAFSNTKGVQDDEVQAEVKPHDPKTCEALVAAGFKDVGGGSYAINRLDVADAKAAFVAKAKEAGLNVVEQAEHVVVVEPAMVTADYVDQDRKPVADADVEKAKKMAKVRQEAKEAFDKEFLPEVKAGASMMVVFKDDGTYHPFQHRDEAVRFLKTKIDDEPEAGWQLGTRKDGVNYGNGEGPKEGDDATEEVSLWIANNEDLYLESRRANDGRSLKDLVYEMMVHNSDINVDWSEVDWDQVYEDVKDEDVVAMLKADFQQDQDRHQKIVDYFRSKGIDYEALGDDSPAQDALMHDHAAEIERHIAGSIKANYLHSHGDEAHTNTHSHKGGEQPHTHDFVTGQTLPVAGPVSERDAHLVSRPAKPGETDRHTGRVQAAWEVVDEKNGEKLWADWSRGKAGSGEFSDDTVSPLTKTNGDEKPSRPLGYISYDEFKTPSGLDIAWSAVHGGLKAGEKAECMGCGKTFDPDAAGAYSATYCSKACYDQDHKETK